MRISFVAASLWLSGGERAIVEFASRLAQRGHTVTLVHPRGTAAPQVIASLDPRVERIETTLEGRRGMGLASSLRLTRQLAGAVPPADVVLATYTPTLPAAWLAARRLRAPLLWLNMDFEETYTGRPLYRFIAAWGATQAARILVISAHLRDMLRSQGVRRPVDVVGLALTDPELYQPLPAEERLVDSLGRKAVMYVGDNRPRKGLEDFLTAATIIHRADPQTVFWLCLKEQPLSTFTVPVEVLVGLPHAELRRRYASCSVFLSTTWREGFGLPPLEAMACGAAVVMTDAGGNRDYARPDENCLLVPPRQPERAAQAVLRVLTESALRERLVREGLRTAQEQDWPAVMDRFERALQAALPVTSPEHLSDN